MSEKEILLALKDNNTLLIMLSEEIGETALSEDPESEATWETIGIDAVNTLLSYPMCSDG